MDYNHDRNHESRKNRKFDLQDMHVDAFSADTDLDWGGVRINPKEEFATEITESELPRPYVVKETSKASQREKNTIAPGEWMGIVAFIASIASLFAWSILLGPLSALSGFVAYRTGSRVAGLWAMIIGGFSFIATILLSPFIV